MSQQTTGSTETPATPSGLAKFFGRWRIRWQGLEKRRLAAEIVQVEKRYADLEGRLSRASAPAEGRDALRERLEGARDGLLAATKESLAGGDTANGWKFLQELEREMVLALDPMELEARFVSAMSEATKKLDGWRGKATQRLVERYEKIGEVSAADGTKAAGQSESRSNSAAEGSADRVAAQRILQEILFHLHSKHQNTYHKLGKQRRQLWLVGTGLVVTLVLIFVLSARDCFAPLGDDVEQTLWLAVASGLTGGVLSLASSVVRRDPNRKIPEMSQSYLVTSIRPFVGATIALPLFFFIESGLLTLGGPDKELPILLALCFIGGFSERWFLGIVEGFGKPAQIGAEPQAES